MGQGPKELLSQLNNLKLGELSSVDGQLGEALVALEALGQSELCSRVDDARRCLKAGKIKEFRRALATVTAKLGHLK